MTAGVDLTDGDFFFGLGTAPAHSEDNLQDIWIEFAEAGHVPAFLDKPRAGERLQFWTNPAVDIDLAAESGATVFRLGVDWGRLVPDCSFDYDYDCGVQDLEALAHYESILGMVRARNMSVMLSLFHHSFPRWGVPPRAPSGPEGAAPRMLWANDNAARHFLAFTRDVVTRLGPLVDYWITFNEAAVFASLTHCVGMWPPGEPVADDLAKLNCMSNPNVGALKAQNEMAMAHRQVYAQIQQIAAASGRRAAPVGVAHLVAYTEVNDVWTDQQNKLFFDTYAKFLFVDLVKDVLDFAGINYYGKEVVEGFSAALRRDIEYSDSGRAIHPVGLFNLLQDFHGRYEDSDAKFAQPGGLGYIVTENGVSDSSDLLRHAYLLEHLAAVGAARDAGIPVRGYMHWTISDNWEWADGYCPQFGMVGVDRSTPGLARTPKSSYYLWQAVARAKRVSGAQRDEAWRRVVRAARGGANHSMCRMDDGQHSRDVAVPWPVLGGSTLPDGTRVDWRFRLSDVDPPCCPHHAATGGWPCHPCVAATTTDLITAGMAFSSESGIDPAASLVSSLAGWSEAHRRQPPSPPSQPSIDVGGVWGSFTAGLSQGVSGLAAQPAARESAPVLALSSAAWPAAAAAAVVAVVGVQAARALRPQRHAAAPPPPRSTLL